MTGWFKYFTYVNLPIADKFTSTLKRKVFQTVQQALARQASVALLGPRQVGKTTLALELASAIAQQQGAIYLDLESSEDRAKLAMPAAFLSA